MSRLEGRTEEEKERIKASMRRLVEGRLKHGNVSEDDAAIKAAMPQAFAEALQVVTAVDEGMSRLGHYPKDDQGRIRALACQLVEGQLVRGTLDCTDAATRAAAFQAIEDARQTVIAVDEFLAL
ncbi:hypothetical protein [Burkholderia ubonensis]|nr:hypothetical protein [Burkholderia ubonensis]